MKVLKRKILAVLWLSIFGTSIQSSHAALLDSVNRIISNPQAIQNSPYATIGALALLFGTVVTRKTHQLYTIKSILNGNYCENGMLPYVLKENESSSIRPARFFGSKVLAKYIRTWHLGYNEFFIPEWNLALKKNEKFKKESLQRPSEAEMITNICTNVKNNKAMELRNEAYTYFQPKNKKEVDVFFEKVEQDLAILYKYLYAVSGEGGENIPVALSKAMKAIYYWIPGFYTFAIKKFQVTLPGFGALNRFINSIYYEIHKRIAWLNTLVEALKEDKENHLVAERAKTIPFYLYSSQRG